MDACIYVCVSTLWIPVTQAKTQAKRLAVGNSLQMGKRKLCLALHAWICVICVSLRYMYEPALPACVTGVNFRCILDAWTCVKRVNFRYMRDHCLVGSNVWIRFTVTTLQLRYNELVNNNQTENKELILKWRTICEPNLCWIVPCVAGTETK